MWTIDSAYQEVRAGAERTRGILKNRARLGFALIRPVMPGASDEEIGAMLRQFNRRRLDAVPDYRAYPELRGMPELIAAEWRGTQDGAGLTDAELAACLGAHAYYHRYITSGREPARCSYIFFPTSEVGPILANNLDSGPEEEFTAPAWPMVNEHVILGGVSSGVYLDEESPELFPAPVFKLVGRYCRTTDEAVEMLARYNHFWGPGNLLVIDRNKRVAMVEKTACRIGVRWSPDGFGFITAMTAEEPGIHAFLEDRRLASLLARGMTEDSNDMRYWRGADARRKLMGELLDEARQAPSLEALRAMIQFRDPVRGYVCYNAEVFHPGDHPVEFTLRTSIWLLREGKARWWAREGDTPSFENRRPDVVFDDVLRWE